MRIDQGLSPEAAEMLARISMGKLIPAGQVLFREGTEGEAVYELKKGRIELSRCLGDGECAIIGHMGPGQMFGEVILFERRNYPVTATALEECVVTFFRRDRFLALLDVPVFRSAFVGMLMSKQRYLTERIRMLSSSNVEHRLRMFLDQHYPGQSRVSMNVSKKNVAAAMGVTPETLSRLITRLRKEGRLVWTGMQIQRSGF
jgi:CRP-like cAMP-binding protein